MTLFFTPPMPLPSRTLNADRRRPSPPRCAMSAPDLDGRRVVLGTSSSWRRTLFERHFPRIEVEWRAADIDEKAAGGDRASADPRTLTLRIAHAKADALLPSLQSGKGDRPPPLLLTADQVVVGPEGIREKPASVAECRSFLASYSAGAPVRAVSGIVVVDCGSGRRFEASDEASQKFTQFGDGVIDALVKEGECMKSAGGVLVEHELLQPYLAERTGELESIQGLPVGATRGLLERAVKAAGEGKE